MGMTASAMDVRLIFSEVGIEGKVHTMEERANIVMSLPHFKAMLNVMLNNLPIIEKSEADAQAALLAEKPN